MKKTSIKSIVSRCCTQPFIVVGALVEKNGKFLLIQEGGKWNQPQGWLELGENIIKGVKRETKEETGFEINIVGFIGVYTLIKRRENKTLHAVKFIFSAKPVRKNVKSKKYNSKWFTFNEIKMMKNKKQLWDSDLPKIIEDYLEKKIYPKNIVSNFTKMI